MNHTRIEQNPLGGGGFAGIDVGGNPNISDAIEGVGAGHGGRLRRVSGKNGLNSTEGVAPTRAKAEQPLDRLSRH
jgi:hypothetical protein